MKAVKIVKNAVKSEVIEVALSVDAEAHNVLVEGVAGIMLQFPTKEEASKHTDLKFDTFDFYAQWGKSLIWKVSHTKVVDKVEKDNGTIFANTFFPKVDTSAPQVHARKVSTPKVSTPKVEVAHQVTKSKRAYIQHSDTDVRAFFNGTHYSIGEQDAILDAIKKDNAPVLLRTCVSKKYATLAKVEWCGMDLRKKSSK